MRSLFAFLLFAVVSITAGLLSTATANPVWVAAKPLKLKLSSSSRSAPWSLRGNAVAVTCEGGRVTVIDTTNGQARPAGILPQGAYCLTWHNDGTLVGVSDTDTAVQVQPATKKVRSLGGYMSADKRLVSPNGKFMIIADRENCGLLVWDLQQSKVLFRLGQFNDLACGHGLTFWSPDSTRFVVERGSLFSVYDLPSGKVIAKLSRPSWFGVVEAHWFAQNRMWLIGSKRLGPHKHVDVAIKYALHGTELVQEDVVEAPPAFQQDSGDKRTVSGHPFANGNGVIFVLSDRNAREIRFWNSLDKKVVHTALSVSDEGYNWSSDISPDGKTLVLQHTGAVCVIDTRKGTRVLQNAKNIKYLDFEPLDVDWSPQSNAFSVLTGNGIQLFRLIRTGVVSRSK